jgi:hypothetical protein
MREGDLDLGKFAIIKGAYVGNVILFEPAKMSFKHLDGFLHIKMTSF